MLLYLESLQPGKTYAVQVRADNGEAFSEWSHTFTLPVTSDTGALPAVGTPTCVPVGDTFVSQWSYASKPTDFSHYEVRWTYDGSNYSPTFKTAGETVTLNFSDNVAFFTTPRPHIRIEIRPVDRTGNKPVTWTPSVYADNPAPTQATNVVGTAGPDKISLAWDKAAFDDYQYAEVWVGTTNAANTTGASRIFSGDVNSWTYVTLSYASVMYFKVAFYDKFNQPGPYSVTAAMTPTNPGLVDVTPPATPNAATVTTTSNLGDPTGYTANLTATWTSKTGDTDLSGHKLRFSTGSTGPWTIVDVPLMDGSTPSGPGSATVATSQTVTLADLIANTNYYVQTASYDKFNNMSAWVSASTYPLLTAKDLIGPSTPAAPTVSSNQTMIQVSHSGLQSDNTTPMNPDLSYYEVYLSTTTPVPATLGVTKPNGIMGAGPAPSGLFSIPSTDGGTSTNTAQTWYAAVVGVDKAGNRGSVLSATSSGQSVPLISAANIAYATITDAKITNLNANKITSGTVFTNDLRVGDLLNNPGTIVVQGQRGFIQSGNYTPGVSGWRLGRDGLEINQGSISAQSFTTGVTNYIPAVYSMFDWGPYLYDSTVPNAITWLTDGVYVGSGIGSNYLASSIDNKSVLVWNANNATPANTNNGFWLGKSSTDYNIFVTPSTTYTFSFYPTMYGSGTFFVRYKDQNGTIVDSGSQTVSSAQTRKTWTFTTSATTTAIVLGFHSFSQGYHEMSALQFEQGGSATTYKYPDNTVIDGASIRTGQITSTATVSINGVVQPVWSINTNGYANFANVLIRGNAVVGAGAGNPTDGAASLMQSANFVTGTSGWQVTSDGNAEYNALIARNSFTIQSAASGARVQLTNSELAAYNSGGTKTVSLTNAGVFTLQSAASAARILLSNSGLFGYNSSGVQSFNLSASSGALTITGSFSLDSDPGSTTRGILISSTGVVYLYPNNGSPPAGLSPGLLYSDTISTLITSPSYTSYSVRATLQLTPGNLSGDQMATFAGDCGLTARGPYSTPLASTRDLVLNSSGLIEYPSSSIRYKTDVRTETYDDYDILALRPVVYKAIADVEEFGDEAPDQAGFIAEEMADDPNWDLFVQRDPDGTIQTIDYKRLVVPAIAKIQDLTRRLAEL